MHPYDAAEALKHFNIKSVILYEVKTFPPTIAHDSDGSNKEFLGIIIETEFKHP